MAKFQQYIKKDGKKAWMYSGYVAKDPITGKEFITTRKGFKTKAEATLSFDKLKLDIIENGNKKKDNTTFKQLYEDWLEQQRKTVKPSTIAISIRYANNQILPAFGTMKLDKISVSYCQKIVNQWHDKYKQYAFLRKVTAQILTYGISMEIIDSNPMKKTILPRKKEEDKPWNFYTKEEVQHFFKCIEDHGNFKQHAFFRILAFTGMRKSEVFATQWKDIDLFNKTISIGKTIAIDEHNEIIMQSPKTKSSTRSISLDDKTIYLLEKWRTKQREDYFKLGFNTSSEEQYVFTNTSNGWFYPQKANEWLSYILGKYNLKKITPHGFRHTHCSLLFESGASIKEVQERLGHKDIKTTMNIYAHVTPKQAEETGAKFAKYIEI